MARGPVASGGSETCEALKFREALLDDGESESVGDMAPPAIRERNEMHIGRNEE